MLISILVLVVLFVIGLFLGDDDHPVVRSILGIISFVSSLFVLYKLDVTGGIVLFYSILITATVLFLPMLIREATYADYEEDTAKVLVWIWSLLCGLIGGFVFQTVVTECFDLTATWVTVVEFVIAFGAAIGGASWASTLLEDGHNLLQAIGCFFIPPLTIVGVCAVITLLVLLLIAIFALTIPVAVIAALAGGGATAIVIVLE